MEQNRRSHVRLKLVALLAALIALWAFAAVVTGQQGVGVLAARTVEDEINRPTGRLIGALQQERRLSVSLLGGDASARAALPASRAATDRVLADWHDRLAGTGVAMAASDALADALAATAAALAGLDQVRTGVDERRLDRAAVLDAFTGMIEAAFTGYRAAGGTDDPDLHRQAAALVTLARAREALSRQDALLSGALAAGEFGTGDRARFTQWVGLRRFLYAEAAAALPATDQAAVAEALAAPEVAELRRVEDLVVAATPGGAPPLTAASWRATADPALAALVNLELAATDRVQERVAGAQFWVIVRLVLAGGLGLAAVLAAVVFSVTTSRALTRQVRKLRDAADELARDKLPRVMARLSAGEPVDVAAEAPPLRFGDDQLGQVGQAFNLVQETAVRAAVSQAELRRGVRDVFLSLARRTQNLVHKQLTVLDEMERRETVPDKVAELYRVDHLATRMRRNAENLIVLSGSRPGRTWRRPVPMIDVIRGAVAEVEDYTRVVLLPVDPAALDGRAVGDLIHLLAELIENAASFSPPYARVSVGGERVAHGYAVAVEDRGLGMTGAELAAANQKLSDPGDFDLADASHLGHYVVAKLAQRHGVRVHLRSSPYGGIVAIVLVPSALLADTPQEERPSAAAPTGRDPWAAAPEPEPAPGAGPTVDLAGEAPADQAPADEAPADEAPADEAPGDTAGGPPGDEAAEPAGEDRAAGAGYGGEDVAAAVADLGGTATAAGAGYGGEDVAAAVADLGGTATAAGAGYGGEDVADAVADLGGSATAAVRTDGGAGPPDGGTDPPTGAAGIPVIRQRRGEDHAPRHLWDAGTDEAAALDAAPDLAAATASGAVGGITPAGLPWRIRQASLPPPEPAEGGTAEPATRDPEQARLMMRAYRRGTLRGRASGPSATGTGAAPAPPTDPKG